MLAELPIAKAEHIDDIKLYLVSRRRMVQESFAGMSPRDPVIYIDKIAFRHQLDNLGAMIRNGGEKSFVELNESGTTLIRIRIVLDIVLMHVFAYCIQIMQLENHFVEFPDNLFVFFDIQCDFLRKRCFPFLP
jgi:hypothetical protein